MLFLSAPGVTTQKFAFHKWNQQPRVIIDYIECSYRTLSSVPRFKDVKYIFHRRPNPLERMDCSKAARSRRPVEAPPTQQQQGGPRVPQDTAVLTNSSYKCSWGQGGNLLWVLSINQQERDFLLCFHQGLSIRLLRSCTLCRSYCPPEVTAKYSAQIGQLALSLKEVLCLSINISLGTNLLWAEY